MKKSIFYSFIALVSIALTLSSCGQKKTDTQEAQENNSETNVQMAEQLTVEEEKEEPQIDSMFQLKKVAFIDENYDIYVEYVDCDSNAVLEKNIQKELGKFLCEHIFLIKPQNLSISEIIMLGLDDFKKDSITKEAIIIISPTVFQKNGITSIVYKCYDSTGGAMNTMYDICHVFRNSDGRRLLFDDILKAESREQFFRIAFDEWNQSGGMKWYNIFSKEGFSETFKYDNEYFKDELSMILKRNFYFTSEGLVFCYNLYEVNDWGSQYGITSLLLAYDKIRSFLNIDM